MHDIYGHKYQKSFLSIIKTICNRECGKYCKNRKYRKCSFKQKTFLTPGSDGNNYESLYKPLYVRTRIRGGIVVYEVAGSALA